jgi:site-specific DNA-methyltransferase (adenine-specific)
MDTWKELNRILKPNALCAVFTSPKNYHRVAIDIEDNGFEIMDQIIWMVTTKMAIQNNLKPTHEPIILARKGKPTLNLDDCRVPWDKAPPTGWKADGHKRRNFGQEKTDSSTAGTIDANPNGRYPGNIIGLFDNKEHQKYFYAPRVSATERKEYANNHPTPKPIDLMNYLIRLTTPKGGKSIDIFMGSGSTLVAANELQITCDGIEIEQAFIDIANARLNDNPDLTDYMFESLFDEKDS